MDEVDLEVRFLETKVRGSDVGLCEVLVTENGVCGSVVHDSWYFPSWERLKEEHPTFESLATEFLLSDNWRVVDNEKVLTFSFFAGEEGLYTPEELDIEIWSSEEDKKLWSEYE